MYMDSLEFYQEIATGLNKDFRTVLHAIATPIGVTIAPICVCNLYRLTSSIETSRVLSGKSLNGKPVKVCLTDYEIICVR